jgi:hypothetical protein
MTNREKLQYHLEKVKYWQSIIDAAEREALEMAWVRINQSYPTPRWHDWLRPNRDVIIPNEFYVAKKILADNFMYARAVSNRNGHQIAVNMYSGVVAIES